MTDIKNIFPDGDIDKIQMNTADIAFNAKILDVQPTISVFQAIDENFDTLNEKITPLNDQLEFLLNTRDMSDQMVVTRLSTWYYDSDSRTLREYQTIKQALDKNPEFSGKINYASDFSFSEPWLELSGRTLTVDLQGHMFTCVSHNFADLRLGSDLTIQNGKIILSGLGGEESKFKIGRGALHLKNVNIESDIVNASGYRLFDIGQIYDMELDDAADAGNSAVDLDKDCTVNVYAGETSAALFYSISPYKCAYDAGRIDNIEEFRTEYPNWRNLTPKVGIDCQIQIFRQTAETPADFLFTADGDKDDRLETVFNLNGDARIYSDTIGFYSGACGTVNISGSPTVIASTGICMRSGTLNIVRSSNPTIIGVGDGKQYDPTYQSDDDFRNLSRLDLGHAVVLESNGAMFGGAPVSADIQAGNFISHGNTAIGSYGSKANASSGHTVEISQNGETLYFNSRAAGFADGIRVDRRESQTEYDYVTGEHPDYRISKYPENPSLNAVKFEKGVTQNLTGNDGLIKAVKDMLILLGVKESDITTT